MSSLGVSQSETDLLLPQKSILERNGQSSTTIKSYKAIDKSPYISYLRQHLSSSTVVDTAIDDDEKQLLSDIYIEDVSRKSSFKHSLFNSLNLLIGLGLLTLPYVLRTSGWIIGVTIITSFALITLYTAQALSRSMDKTQAQDYVDLACKTFGRPGQMIIGTILIVELFASTCAFNIVIADSLHALLPDYDQNFLLTITFLVFLLPSSWTNNLQYLSAGSMVGILGSVLLLGITVFDGATKKEFPGSLLHPAKTRLWPVNWWAVPANFGAVIFCYSGHAVFGSVYRQMKKPQQFVSLMNITYLFCSVWFLAIAFVGYFMFGDLTLEELTLNISSESSYQPVLTKILLVITTILPISKFSLLLNPVCQCFESWLLPSTHASSSTSFSGLRLVLRTLLRSFIAATTLLVAIFFPSFHGVVSLIGCILSFTLCFIAPALCHLKACGGDLSITEKLVNVGIATLGLGLGVSGCVVPLIK